VHRPIARYLKRHRDRLADAVARSLSATLGPGRARDEARSLVEGLQGAFLASDARAFVEPLQTRIAAWCEAGVDERGVGEALLALVRTPVAEPRGRAVREWFRSLRPMLEFVPTPTIYVDARFRIRTVNEAMSRLLGETEGMLEGRRLTELLELDMTGMVAALTSAPAGGDDSVRLGRVRLRGRPREDLLASRLPFSSGGRVLGWFFTFSPGGSRDIADASMSEMLDREKRQNEKFAALLAVSHAVVNTLDLNVILTTIAKKVREVIQTDECTVFLFDEKEQLLYPVVCDAKAYVEEVMAVRLKLGEGITGMVALTGRGEIVDDAEADPRSVSVPGTPPEQMALLCVPLQNQDKVVGVITLSRIGQRTFQHEDLELATLFAGQCSAAIANARMYESMKAAYDELRDTQAQLVQAAKLNALGEMAGGVAHDFNNILAAILGRTQLLLQTVPEPELRRQLLVVEQAALDGAQTVRRVQEFTRVRQDEHFETVDINQVLSGVTELTRPVWESGAKRRGVTIDVHLELGATSTTVGNASELREVFTNLVLNAVDAMPNGGELWITSSNAAGAVSVQIRDTGVGMDAATLDRIFDPFFTTKLAKGTGLGLSVAYGIVTRHRGTISVDSEPAVGTLFTLAFPVGTAPEVRSADADDSPLPRMRVLVVDDEEVVLEVLADLLTALGMDVTRAHGGVAGVEAVQHAEFDVVFTDLGMPEVNGWDMATAAKARRPSTSVVMVTGWGFQLGEETAVSSGVDLIIAKPFSWDDVRQALRQVAQQSDRAAA
jgi:signal transduction histidine kinase/ActR/RegA family two-component response regulator/PAS domain-containing protein